MYTGESQDEQNYVFKLPLLISFFKKKIEVLSLSKSDTHNTCGDGLLVVTYAAVLS
jgi:hypothetical protein